MSHGLNLNRGSNSLNSASGRIKFLLLGIISRLLKKIFKKTENPISVYCSVVYKHYPQEKLLIFKYKNIEGLINCFLSHFSSRQGSLGVIFSTLYIKIYYRFYTGSPTKNVSFELKKCFIFYMACGIFSKT